MINLNLFQFAVFDIYPKYSTLFPEYLNKY